LDARSWVVIVFLLMMFVMHSGQSIGGPAWTGWMADIVPKRVRGKYFGHRRALAVLSGVPAAMVAGWVLDRYARDAAPLVTLACCGVLFFIASIFGLCDISVFHFVPEVPTPARPDTHLLKSLGAPLRDREYMWFAGFVASMTFAVSFMGQFVTLYLIERIGVTNMGTQMMLLVAPSLTQMVFLPVWGKLVDRMGKKPALAIASLGLVPVGLGWCLMNAGLIWLGYVLSSLGAAFYTGVEIANSNMMLELAGSRDGQAGGGSAYVAVNNVISSIAGCAGGLSSGLLAQWLGSWSMRFGHFGIGSITFYEVLFALSALFRLLAAVVFLPKIHEPHARPAHVALRYMTANIYNNLFSAVLLPLRFVAKRFADEE
jgi:MFS family permease